MVINYLLFRQGSMVISEISLGIVYSKLMEEAIIVVSFANKNYIANNTSVIHHKESKTYKIVYRKEAWTPR